MVPKKEEGTYHCIEKLRKETPGSLSPGRGLPLLLIPEYSRINKEQRILDRSRTAHRKPPVKCFLTQGNLDYPLLYIAPLPVGYCGKKGENISSFALSLRELLHWR